MTDMIPRPSRNVTPLATPPGFSRPEAKALQRRQNAETADGVVIASRVHAAALVAATGMQLSSMLSREAEFQANGNPRAAERLDFIADSFAEYAAWEVRRYQR